MVPLPSNLYHQDDITLLYTFTKGICRDPIIFPDILGTQKFHDRTLKQTNRDAEPKFWQILSRCNVAKKTQRMVFSAQSVGPQKSVRSVFPDFLKSNNSGISTFRAPQQKIDSTCPTQKTCIYPKNPANIYQVFDATTASVGGRTLLKRVIMTGCSKARSLRIYSNENYFQKEWIVFQLSFCMAWVMLVFATVSSW